MSHWRLHYRSEELQVWDVMNNDGREIGLRNGESISNGMMTPHLAVSRRVPSAARMIPVAQRDEQPRVMQHSAPVNIPDWSKIYGKTPTRKIDSFASSSIYDHDDHDRLPPHEWLAKKHSRSQISSFSVCEGAGRTLKGRDLSRVRNAVLSKTGFI